MTNEQIEYCHRRISFMGGTGTIIDAWLYAAPKADPVCMLKVKDDMGHIWHLHAAECYEHKG
jgi:hypothetical protein